MGRRRRRRRKTPAPSPDTATNASGAETSGGASEAGEIAAQGGASDKSLPTEAHPSGNDVRPANGDGRHRYGERGKAEGRGARRPPPRYAALDLGTNNCRLLIAAPRGRGFRIVDAYSRIVRLGEGVSRTGVLSEEAMERTRDALKTCAEKIARRGVTRSRLIATQACRAAANGEEFLAEVKRDIGLHFDIISTEEEARLAVAGCGDLIDPAVEAVVVFDIGGGSTEISFLKITGAREDGSARHELAAWFSMPFGVVNLSERWGGRDINAETYQKIVDDIAAIIRAEGDPAKIRAAFDSGRAHLLGTSGTVTSIAGVHLGLKRYRRDDVDGLWLSAEEARSVSQRLCDMTYEERALEPCIGEERADLVVCGCAILDAILAVWPTDRIRVADRGLREGLLAGMAAADARRRRNSRRRRRGRNSSQKSADQTSNLIT